MGYNGVQDKSARMIITFISTVITQCYQRRKDNRRGVRVSVFLDENAGRLAKIKWLICSLHNNKTNWYID